MPKVMTGDNTPVLQRPTKPRRRRRSRSRTRSHTPTVGGTQLLSVTRRPGTRTGIADLINEEIAIAQDVKAFKPGFDVQMLANLWARAAAHRGLTL